VVAKSGGNKLSTGAGTWVDRVGEATIRCTAQLCRILHAVGRQKYDYLCPSFAGSRVIKYEI
jgi:hypothetical protein